MKGDRQKLPRFSHFQGYVQWKVAMVYGYDVMEEIESKRNAWCEEAVRDFLYVPKPHRNQSKRRLWETFLSIKDNWSLGRSMHIDRVVINYPDKKSQAWFSSIQGPDGRMIQIHCKRDDTILVT